MKKQKRKKSRRKGRRGEVEVASLLSKWLGLDLKRTPMSGAMWGYPSDIIPSSASEVSDFPFLIEVKLQEGWDLTSFVSGKDVVFKGWIKQVEDEVDRLKKPFYMLFFRKNRFPWFVAIPISQVKDPEILLPRLYLGNYLITLFSVVEKFRPEEVFLGLRKDLGSRDKKWNSSHNNR